MPHNPITPSLRRTTTSYAKATQSTHPQNAISFSIVVQLRNSEKILVNYLKKFMFIY
jgi:hypothetical protein